jgi:alpha-beta hydrolase superfamily lysophospholipase
MEHIEGNFKGVRNTNIYYQAWLPGGDVKAVILLLHGLGDHSGRYMNVVNHFVPLGYAIYAMDYIGHGKSDGDREIIAKFEDFTDTLTIYLNMVKDWQKDKQIFVLGHSLGGTIIAFYLLDHQAEFKGVVISAPVVKVGDSVSATTITMSRILSNILPWMGVKTLDTSLISKDPLVVQAYINDPLVFHGKTPARMAAEMLSAMQRISAEAGKITLPIIIVQGGDDKLVDPAGAQMLNDLASSRDKTLEIYPGMYHEVFNEPNRMVVLKEVETWLEARS